MPQAKLPQRNLFFPEKRIAKDILLLLGRSSPSKGCTTQQFSVIITEVFGLVPASFAQFHTDRSTNQLSSYLSSAAGRCTAPGPLYPGLGFQTLATSPKAPSCSHRGEQPRSEQAQASPGTTPAQSSYRPCEDPGMEDTFSARHHGSWGSLRIVGAATSPSYEKIKGARWAKGRAREGGASERCLPPAPRQALRGAGVTLVCVPARPGERWPDTAERPGSWAGVLLRELQTLGSEPPPPLLCGSAALPGLTLPQQELRVCAAPLACLSSPLSPRACHPRADISVHPGHHGSFQGSLVSLC